MMVGRGAECCGGRKAGAWKNGASEFDRVEGSCFGLLLLLFT